MSDLRVVNMSDSTSADEFLEEMKGRFVGHVVILGNAPDGDFLAESNNMRRDKAIYQMEKLKHILLTSED